MANVLVAYGSKYGATAEIAERIGQVLQAAGVAAEVLPADKVRDPAAYAYDAVVLGSAAYIFHWRRDAAKLLRILAAKPYAGPVWLFSSGPTDKSDADAFPEGAKLPKGLQSYADRLRPRDIAVFGGALDLAKLGPVERWIMKRMKATAADVRNWDTIESWAGAIAQALAT